MWSKVIYRSINHLSEEISSDKIAEGLYEDMRQHSRFLSFPGNSGTGFNSLRAAEKKFWQHFVSEIPDKLLALNLFIRRFDDVCRTCIITDEEIETLTGMDSDSYLTNRSLKDLKNEKSVETGITMHPVPESYLGLVSDWDGFFRELNYLIPVELKKSKYELLRYEEDVEISAPMIIKLARAIHSKYLHEVRSQNKKTDNDPDSSKYNPAPDIKNPNLTDFDSLPEEIKNSNIDNATHIPTKLLSIGYKIRPVKKGFKTFALHLKKEEVETMSRVEHARWSWEKRLNGWVHGNVKDEILKTHPGLIPYNQLTESEKEKDRELIRVIPSLLKDIDYEAYPISTHRIRNLSYALKPQSAIHKILDETRQMNNQIRSMVTLTPEVEEMVRIRNRKIEDAIHEVEGSYNYAQRIQETFLPDDLYIRECFPDSFILFKPKDIVSGDFYFFSKRDNLIIFAAADCTGHGIPGALLSTLGYGILDQAVNEIKLTDPSGILRHLYSKIHRFLRRGSEGRGVSDDMDLILCILDISTSMLSYSGVKNPLYRITKGELIEYRPTNSPEYTNNSERAIFSSEVIQLEAGDTIYLCSDGYADQFGGKNHKKYQKVRLKNLLISTQQCSLAEQGDRLYEEFELWREENDEIQTDDILVIGIRI
jgi:serine phosphatase RsbU (regulator of sigma subunit)